MDLHVVSKTIESVRAVPDPRDRLRAYTAYLGRLDERRVLAVTERDQLVARLRRADPKPTYRELADLTGLSEGYVRQLTSPKKAAS